jgi:glycosyltransferase involved in cell wall biosynthesis
MEHNSPILSIVTICYNSKAEIGRTLKSVFDQDADFFEYIIIDGGSTDGTLEILHSYERKFSDRGIPFRLISEKDDGIYSAMNKGVGLARGKWVNILNGGDQFHPDFSLRKLFEDPKEGLIYFGKSITHYKGITSVRYKNFHTEKAGWYLSFMPNHQAVFIPENFYRNNQYDLRLHFSSDTLYMRKAFQELDFSCSDQIVSLFELGGASSYYRSRSNLKKILKDIDHLESDKLKAARLKINHTLKFFLQTLMGRERYLKFYIRHILKEQ